MELNIGGTDRQTVLGRGGGGGVAQGLGIYLFAFRGGR